MSNMSAPKRATVYFDAEVHRALRLKAAATDRTISELVNDAVKAAMTEDAEDLEAFSRRQAGTRLSFETFVRGLKRRGRL